MLRHLKLEKIGPVKTLSVDLADRLNVFTGDNGLGKSFLLDVCFWTMTDRWPGDGRIALPEPGAGAPGIKYKMSKNENRLECGLYDTLSQCWDPEFPRELPEGVVIYAMADGGVSVRNGARYELNRQLSSNSRYDPREFPPDTYHFTPELLTDGLEENGHRVCNGLIQDWVTWYLEQSSNSSTNAFGYLEEVVSLLSHPQEPVQCDEPQRVFVNDARRYPTLRMPYGRVPFPQWPAGIRRIISLAYMIVWAWTEHLETCQLTNQPPTDQLVILIDEIECHLHPKWQRTILPALLRVAEKLAPELNIQLLVTTHSPLVLASLEPHFDKEHDKLFWFDIEGGEVRFQDLPWAAHGDVVGWLTSDIFGLKEARFREADLQQGKDWRE